jgi:hypothetical protein
MMTIAAYMKGAPGRAPVDPHPALGRMFDREFTEYKAQFGIS